MEEDTVDLTDYLRVIWKRKILIIVGTLVCVIFGVVMSLRLPEVYRAEAILRIGATIDASNRRILVDQPRDMVKIIPVMYALEDEEALGYNLSANVVPDSLLINIYMKGPDIEKVIELLGKISEKIVEDQNNVIETTIQSYMELIERSAERIKKVIEISEKTNAESGVNKTDLELSLQNRLNKSDAMQYDREEIFRSRLIVDDLKRNKTRQVGGVREVIVRKGKISTVLIAGFAGLAMFIFLAFIIEFLGNVIEKEKRKSKS